MGQKTTTTPDLQLRKDIVLTGNVVDTVVDDDVDAIGLGLVIRDLLL